MKNLVSILALVIATAAGAFVVYSNMKPSKAAFVLNQKLFDGFKGKQFLEKELNALKAKHKQSLDSISNVLNSNPSNVVVSNHYQAKLRSFQVEEEQRSNEFSAEIWKQINASLAEFGKKNNYTFILGASGNGNLMYASEQIDVTDEAILFINARYEGNE